MEANFLINVLFPILVIVVMFGLGMSLTPDDFKRITVYPKATIIGLTNQLVLLPVIGFLLAYLLNLNPELAVGLIIIAAAPGGTSSNVITHLLEADTALSITLTVLSSLVAFITIPFWVGLALSLFTEGATEAISVPFARIALQVAILTLIPLGAGMLVCYRWPGLAKRTKTLVRVGSGVLLVIAIVSFLIDQNEKLLIYFAQAGLAAVILCIATVSIGYFLARLFALSPATRATIAIETGIQNIPLSLFIAANLLSNPGFAIPTAAYGLMMIVLMAIILVGVVFQWPIFRFGTVK